MPTYGQVPSRGVKRRSQRTKLPLNTTKKAKRKVLPVNDSDTPSEDSRVVLANEWTKDFSKSMQKNEIDEKVL